jgi:hypothetical protein
MSGQRYLERAALSSRHTRDRAVAGGNGLVRVLLHPVDEGPVCLGIGDRNLMGLFNQAVLRVPLEPAQCVASRIAEGPHLAR